MRWGSGNDQAMAKEAAGGRANGTPGFGLNGHCEQNNRHRERRSMTPTTQPLTTHPVAEMYAEEYKAGKLSRREFLARSTALGVGAAAAYSLIGLNPAEAGATCATPADGRHLRIQMERARAQGPADL
jgi:hypothetical protein